MVWRRSPLFPRGEASYATDKSDAVHSISKRRARVTGRPRLYTSPVRDPRWLVTGPLFRSANLAAGDQQGTTVLTFWMYSDSATQTVMPMQCREAASCFAPRRGAQCLSTSKISRRLELEQIRAATAAGRVRNDLGRAGGTACRSRVSRPSRARKGGERTKQLSPSSNHPSGLDVSGDLVPGRVSNLEGPHCRRAFHHSR